MIDLKKLVEFRKNHFLCANECCLRNELIDDIEVLLKENAELEETVRWVAQTVHQAYHEKDTFMECSKNTCDAAKQCLAALREGEGK